MTPPPHMTPGSAATKSKGAGNPRCGCMEEEECCADEGAALHPQAAMHLRGNLAGKALSIHKIYHINLRSLLQQALQHLDSQSWKGF